ncbi:MAG: hypothetical protein D6784_18545 [Chloroflexi bacterium]|nr:MAG: hypothetical protein D6784_18545 [Chloroflexota bacterium]
MSPVIIKSKQTGVAVFCLDDTFSQFILSLFTRTRSQLSSDVDGSCQHGLCIGQFYDAQLSRLVKRQSFLDKIIKRSFTRAKIRCNTSQKFDQTVW